MEMPELEDLEDKNIVGGIDGLVVSLGLAILAVLPTLFIVTFMPWRAASLVAGDRPSGRVGYILGPGIFFVAAIVSTLAVSSLVPNAPSPPVASEQVIETNETTALTTSAFRAGLEAGRRNAQDEDEEEDDGPSRGARILDGLSSGNIWKAAATISPFFLWACLIGGISCAWAAVLQVKKWTLRAAIGSGLYFATTFTVITVITVQIIRLVYGGEIEDLPNFTIGILAMVFILPILALPWQTFWFIKGFTGDTAHKSGLITLGTTATLVFMGLAFGFIAAITALTPPTAAPQAELEAAEAQEHVIEAPPTTETETLQTLPQESDSNELSVNTDG